MEANKALFISMRQILIMALCALEDYMIATGLLAADRKSIAPRRKRAVGQAELSPELKEIN